MHLAKQSHQHGGLATSRGTNDDVELSWLETNFSLHAQLEHFTGRLLFTDSGVIRPREDSRPKPDIWVLAGNSCSSRRIRVAIEEIRL